MLRRRYVYQLIYPPPHQQRTAAPVTALSSCLLPTQSFYSRSTRRRTATPLPVTVRRERRGGCILSPVTSLEVVPGDVGGV